MPNPCFGLPSMLPQGLVQELSDLEYLTPHQLEKIKWNQAVAVPRRSSAFTRQLDAMQKAAR